MDDPIGNAAVIADLATSAMEVQEVNGTPFVIRPDGHKVEELAHLLPAPKSIREEVSFTELSSFIRYVNQFKQDSTFIGASVSGTAIKATLDYHGPGAPSHCRHVAKCDLTDDCRWDAWLNKDGVGMAQDQFALFIEDRADDIVEPGAATLMEIGKSLKATKKVRYESGKDLANGAVQLTYNEDVQGSIGKGNIEIPAEFVIGIPRFTGGEKYKIIAKFRYRLNGGQLIMNYNLKKLDAIKDDARHGLIKEIKEKTGIEPFV